MQLDKFLAKLSNSKKIQFSETLSIIDENYNYYPVRFTNGIGSDTIANDPGCNEGSCKIFFFAKLHQLPKNVTLTLFGDYYWLEVLKKPTGDNHTNIRNFIKHGWEGIEFSNEALILRK
ncbi:MAG: HopJ type III effector protein [Methylococcales bacterium]